MLTWLKGWGLLWFFGGFPISFLYIFFIFLLYLRYISFIFPPYFFHISSLLPWYFRDISFIFPSYFLHISFIFLWDVLDMSSVFPPRPRSLIHVWYHPIEPSRALHWAPLSSLLDHFRSRRKLCWMVVDCVQDQRWNCVGISSMFRFFHWDFWVFWGSVDYFGESWGLLQIYNRFSQFLVDFGRVLGGHLGASLEAKTVENGENIDFCTIFESI